MDSKDMKSGQCTSSSKGKTCRRLRSNTCVPDAQIGLNANQQSSESQEDLESPLSVGDKSSLQTLSATEQNCDEAESTITGDSLHSSDFCAKDKSQKCQDNNMLPIIPQNTNLDVTGVLLHSPGQNEESALVTSVEDKFSGICTESVDVLKPFLHNVNQGEYEEDNERNVANGTEENPLQKSSGILLSKDDKKIQNTLPAVGETHLTVSSKGRKEACCDSNITSVKLPVPDVENLECGHLKHKDEIYTLHTCLSRTTVLCKDADFNKSLSSNITNSADASAVDGSISCMMSDKMCKITEGKTCGRTVNMHTLDSHYKLPVFGGSKQLGNTERDDIEIVEMDCQMPQSTDLTSNWTEGGNVGNCTNKIPSHLDGTHYMTTVSVQQISDKRDMALEGRSAGIIMEDNSSDNKQSACIGTENTVAENLIMPGRRETRSNIVDTLHLPNEEMVSTLRNSSKDFTHSNHIPSVTSTSQLALPMKRVHDADISLSQKHSKKFKLPSQREISNQYMSLPTCSDESHVIAGNVTQTKDSEIDMFQSNDNPSEIRKDLPSEIVVPNLNCEQNYVNIHDVEDMSEKETDITVDDKTMKCAAQRMGETDLEPPASTSCNTTCFGESNFSNFTECGDDVSHQKEITFKCQSAETATGTENLLPEPTGGSDKGNKQRLMTHESTLELKKSPLPMPALMESSDSHQSMPVTESLTCGSSNSIHLCTSKDSGHAHSVLSDEVSFLKSQNLTTLQGDLLAEAENGFSTDAYTDCITFSIKAPYCKTPSDNLRESTMQSAATEPHFSGTQGFTTCYISPESPPKFQNCSGEREISPKFLVTEEKNYFTHNLNPSDHLSTLASQGTDFPRLINTCSPTANVTNTSEWMPAVINLKPSNSETTNESISEIEDGIRNHHPANPSYGQADAGDDLSKASPNDTEPTVTDLEKIYSAAKALLNSDRNNISGNKTNERCGKLSPQKMFESEQVGGDECNSQHIPSHTDSELHKELFSRQEDSRSHFCGEMDTGVLRNKKAVDRSEDCTVFKSPVSEMDELNLLPKPVISPQQFSSFFASDVHGNGTDDCREIHVLDNVCLRETTTVPITTENTSLTLHSTGRTTQQNSVTNARQTFVNTTTTTSGRETYPILDQVNHHYHEHHPQCKTESASETYCNSNYTESPPVIINTKMSLPLPAASQNQPSSSLIIEEADENEGTQNSQLYGITQAPVTACPLKRDMSACETIWPSEDSRKIEEVNLSSSKFPGKAVSSRGNDAGPDYPQGNSLRAVVPESSKGAGGNDIGTVHLQSNSARTVAPKTSKDAGGNDIGSVHLQDSSPRTVTPKTSKDEQILPITSVRPTVTHHESNDGDVISEPVTLSKLSSSTTSPVQSMNLSKIQVSPSVHHLVPSRAATEIKECQDNSETFIEFEDSVRQAQNQLKSPEDFQETTKATVSQSFDDPSMDISESQLLLFAAEDFEQEFETAIRTKVTKPANTATIHTANGNITNTFHTSAFEQECDEVQKKALQEINAKKAEGEKLIGVVMADLMSINKQLLKMKREMEAMKKRIGQQKQQQQKQQSSQAHQQQQWISRFPSARGSHTKTTL